MTYENIKRGNDIQKSLETIKKLKSIVCNPYPKMFKNMADKKRGFIYEDDIISFYSLDDKTREALKDCMMRYLTDREAELEEEFKNI